MIEKLKRYKWLLLWIGFAVLATAYVTGLFIFSEKVWFDRFLNTFGILCSLYIAVLVFFHSRAESEKALRAQIDKLQELTNDQILAFKEAINEQILSFETGIQAQIDNYSDETVKVVRQLKDNSIILAKSLQNQLENDYKKINKELNTARNNFTERKRWKLLRTPATKNAEIQRWERYIAALENQLKYLKDKWDNTNDYINGHND